MSVLIIIRSGPQYSLKCEHFVNGLENLFLPANRLRQFFGKRVCHKDPDEKVV